ncbi:hypothetical protein B0T25DRAFT_215146 [Lasiosphaeria hispida]|uniref:Uncharacterized protein n=1 Tax=Lasiosphaeria hispida TaxID=260671 RepID=A0AAJ0HJK7_9PEZI|nr:hypothetical protein B0T25DRAFT_215146 [Lasiosphaeria hispida]
MLESLKARGYVGLPGQDHSYFLYLPAEIRFNIYKLAYTVEKRVPSPNNNRWNAYVAKHQAQLDFLRNQLDQISTLAAVCRGMRADVYGEFFHHTVFSISTLKFSRRPHLDRAPPAASDPLCWMRGSSLLTAQLRHINWTWTGEHGKRDQEPVLNWMLSLEGLCTLNIAIKDPEIYRRTLPSGRRHAQFTGEGKISMAKVNNASLISQFRGLDSLSFELWFDDQNVAR